MTAEQALILTTFCGLPLAFLAGMLVRDRQLRHILEQQKQKASRAVLRLVRERSE